MGRTSGDAHGKSNGDDRMNQLHCITPTGDLLAQCRPKQMGVQCAVSDESVDIFLHGIIGDEFTETDSLSVARVLADNRGKAVNLRVNSPGGLAYDGVAMYNAIDAHDGTTTGTIEGMAGSAASLAVVACDTVRCHSTARFHPHYAMLMAFGHQSDIRDALDSLQQLDTDLEKVYAEASGQSIAQVQKDLTGPHGDGTKFSAEAALAAGYVDEVIKHNKQKPATPVPDAAIQGATAAMLRRNIINITEMKFDTPARIS